MSDTTIGVRIEAGQCWTYRAPGGFENSRLIVGAVVRFENREDIVCASAVHAPPRNPEPSEQIKAPSTTVAFIPMTETAFRASVIHCEGTAEPPEAFASSLQSWQADPKGLSVFKVPFEGSLDRMIALQMAQIVGQPAA